MRSGHVDKLPTAPSPTWLAPITLDAMQVEVGEALMVVGNTAELGAWEQSAGLPLEWTEGHIWTGSAAAAADGKLAFKFVKVSADGAAEWEHGEDRTLTFLDVPEEAIDVHADWGHPAEFVPTASDVSDMSTVRSAPAY